MMKLKIDVFSDSKIFLESALKMELICCLFQIAFFTESIHYIERKCKTAFPITFNPMKLKAGS